MGKLDVAGTICISGANCISSWPVGSVTMVAGTAPITVTNGATTPSISIAQAGVASNGYIASADWTVFNGKEPSVTAGTTAQYYRGDKSWQTLNSAVVAETTNLYYLDARARLAFSASAPIAYSSASGDLSMAAATNVANGYLAAADWITFNGKQAPLAAATSSSNGYLTSSDWTSFNNATTQWTTSGANVYRAGGKVGIGISNPSGILHARAPSGTWANYYFDTTDSSGSYATVTLSLNKAGNSNWSLQSRGDTDNSLSFNGSTNQQIMNMQQSGNVIIGTTSALNKLDVAGGMAIGTTYTQTAFAPTEGLIVQGNVGIGTTSPSGFFDVKQAFTVAKSGNVGIGTMSPFGLLDVNQKLIVTNSGSVGIGVNFPMNRLQVGADTSWSNSGAEGQLLVSGQTNPTKRVEVGFDTTNGYGFLAAYDTGSWRPLIINPTAGNVGIGTANPNGALHIYSSSMGGQAIVESNSTDTAMMLRNDSSGGRGWALGSGGNSSGSGPNFYVFDTMATATRFAINGSGNVGIGTTSPTSTLHVAGSNTNGFMEFINNTAGSTTSHGLMIQAGSNSSAGATMVYLTRPDGTAIGSISQNSATTVAFNTTSDRRLKENIAASSSGIDALRQIRVRDYNYIADPEKTTLQGFIAQELYDIYPQAVTIGGDDPTHAPWQVDYGRLTPLLVKSVQELDQDMKADAATKEAQIAELIARLDKTDAHAKKVEAESATLKARADKAEAEAAQLKAFLCGQFPNAPMCQP